jgi:hypothetical protein
MIISETHRNIIAAVTALYPGKGFELDGQNLTWQTFDAEGVLQDGVLAEPTAEEAEAIMNRINS